MSKTDFFYHTHDPRYGHKIKVLPAVKMGKPIFFTVAALFCPPGHGCDPRIWFLTFFIIFRCCQQNKNGKFFLLLAPIFCPYLHFAVKPSKIAEKHKKPNSFITPMIRYMDQNAFFIIFRKPAFFCLSWV